MKMNDRMKSCGRSVVVGGLASTISRTLVTPFERVYFLRLAVPLGENPNGLKIFVSKFGMLYRNQPQDFGFVRKVCSFYRGNMSNCVRFAPLVITSFLVRGQVRKSLYGDRHRKVGFAQDLYYSLLAGGIAGFAGLSVSYPLDYCRRLLTAKYGGLTDCFVQALRRDGFMSMYKGFVSCAVGVVSYRAAYFGLYDFGKNRLLNSDAGFLKRLALAQATTSVSQFLCYPCDAVRRRMMLYLPGRKARQGFIECARTILREEGLLGFYRGYASSILRSTGSALCLVLYDIIGRKLFRAKDFGGD